MAGNVKLLLTQCVVNYSKFPSMVNVSFVTFRPLGLDLLVLKEMLLEQHAIPYLYYNYNKFLNIITIIITGNLCINIFKFLTDDCLLAHNF